MTSAFKRPKVYDHKDVNPDNSWESENCLKVGKRLEDGPATPANYSVSNKFTDLTFNGTDQVYDPLYSHPFSKSVWEYYFKNYYGF